MQVTETLSEGLKRELKLVVPAHDLSSRLDQRLVEMKDRVRINGFRPGKVPVAHLRRLVGRQEMAQIIDNVIGETIRKVVEDRNERPALNPEVKLSEEVEAEKLVDGEADLIFIATYELLPAFEIQDFSTIAVERPVAEVAETEVDEQLARIAEGNRPFVEKEGAAATGDRVTIDFVGKIDGEAFEGGSGEGVDLTLGSGQFIPGFEDQLVGASAGDARTVEVAFPAEYPAKHLAGKAATFDVTVKSVSAPGELVVDDEWATKLGLESLDKLKEILREQIRSQYDQASRAKVKRALLDQLDGVYQFDLPEKLVEGEFEQIWKQVVDEMTQAGKSFADENTTEEAAKADYRRIAERRVRLGLVLSEVGEKNEVQVTDDEVSRALVERARQFPGQEREVFEYYRKTPAALATLRAPLFEEKVVDFILGKAQVTDKTVAKDELFKETEEA
ncbi:trigger factor [Prosthecomicrobium hirschii]|uniref:trigger factor n=1 Tax=Prosthecodimorpha hirschii TaxID=665126 RepID=UPI00112C70E8|nr:trigger factor [Prosthecomicrobium hirschii]TPQ48157.1 trigger factor [Prosthecomicrobium hirschii]